MNTWKLFALGTAAASLLLATAIVAPAWADTAPEGKAPTLQAQQEHLWQMRNIMHYARFTAAPVDKGVSVQVTSTDAGLVEAIRAEFGHRHELASPVAGSQVATAETEGGVTLTFTAGDEATVRTLQGYGAGLAYTILRDNMHEAMWGLRGQQGYGPGYGPGWGRGGWGHMGPGHMMGPGYGPGAGQGYGRGYGPGMMGPGYGPGNGPGSDR